MRKIFSVMLATVLLLSTLSLAGLSAAAETLSGSCGNGVNWSLDTATGALTISGNGGMTDEEGYLAPWFNSMSTIKTVTVGDGVTSISDMAFLNATALESVTIGKGVKKLGISVFEGCSALASVTLPDAVETIGSYSFRNCTSLKSIIVSASNANFNTTDGVLYNKGQTKLIAYPAGKDAASFDIPGTVTEIADYAVAYNPYLVSVTIPDSVTTVQTSVFNGCTKLESVTIGANVQSIRYAMFENCKALKEVVIPDSALSIEDNAFQGCTSLVSVKVGEGVKSIGSRAFSGCSALVTLNIPEKVERVDGYAFYGCSSIGYVVLESETIAASLSEESSAGRLLSYTKAIAYGGKATTVTSYAKKILKYSEKIELNGTKYNVYANHAHRWGTYTVDTENCGDVGFEGSKCTTCTLIKGNEKVIDHVYDDDCDEECNNCGEKREAPHDYELKHDEANHWYECALCGNKKDVSAHVYDDDKDADCNVCGEKREVKTGLLGDVNGDGSVDNLDAAEVLRYDAGLISLTDDQLTRGDVDASGGVDNLDAAAILRYDAGLISSF